MSVRFVRFKTSLFDIREIKEGAMPRFWAFADNDLGGASVWMSMFCISQRVFSQVPQIFVCFAARLTIFTCLGSLGTSRRDHCLGVF